MPITPNACMCVADGCTTWTFAAGAAEMGFLDLLWGPEHLIFCSPDHLLTTVAQRSTPMTVIDIDIDSE